MPIEGETRISPTGVKEVYNPFGEWVSAPTPEEVAQFPAPKETAVIGPGIDEVEEEIADFEKATEVKDELGEPIEYLYDIDVYKGEEAIRVSNVNVQEYLDKGWSTTKPAEELPEDVLDEDEEEKTPEELEAEGIASDIEDADKAIADAQSKVLEVRASISDDSSFEELGVIQSIRLDYESRREDVREMGDRQRKALQTFNIRRGTQRYAAETAEGIITEQERLLLRELSNLKSEENRLVAEMKREIMNENYEGYLDLKEDLEKARKEKVDQLKALNKEILKKNDEIEEENKLQREQSSILKEYEKGNTTAAGIFSALNEKVKLELIEETLNIIQEDKSRTDADRIKDVEHLISSNTSINLASNYVKAQQQWIASGGTITDFKAAFPPESVMSKDELTKLPSSIYKPPKEPTPTQAQQKQQAIVIVSSQLNEVVGDDLYVSPEDYRIAKKKWQDGGYEATYGEFDKLFRRFVNPTHRNDYTSSTTSDVTGDKPSYDDF